MTLVPPITINPATTWMRIAATSLTRRGTRSTSPCTVTLRRHAKDVADATKGVDQPRLTGVDLAAQVGDVRLDDAVVAAEVVAPDVVEDLPLGQHPAGVGHQVAQQLELGGRQRDPVAVAPDLVRLLVELQV